MYQKQQQKNKGILNIWAVAGLSLQVRPPTSKRTAGFSLYPYRSAVDPESAKYRWHPFLGGNGIGTKAANNPSCFIIPLRHKKRPEAGLFKIIHLIFRNKTVRSVEERISLDRS